MIKLVGLVPLFPLIGFLINGFFGKKMSKSLSGIIASGAILASFVVSLLVVLAAAQYRIIHRTSRKDYLRTEILSMLRKVISIIVRVMRNWYEQ